MDPVMIWLGFLGAATLVLIGACVWVVIEMGLFARALKEGGQPDEQTYCLDRDAHGVPWPVMSVAGDLVGWLCGVCGEQRRRFTCPDVPKVAKCEHPNLDETHDFGTGIITKFCPDCRQTIRTTMEFDIPMPILYEEGEEKQVQTLKPKRHVVCAHEEMDEVDICNASGEVVLVYRMCSCCGLPEDTPPLVFGGPDEGEPWWDHKPAAKLRIDAARPGVNKVHEMLTDLKVQSAFLTELVALAEEFGDDDARAAWAAELKQVEKKRSDARPCKEGWGR